MAVVRSEGATWSTRTEGSSDMKQNTSIRTVCTSAQRGTQALADSFFNVIKTSVTSTPGFGERPN